MVTTKSCLEMCELRKKNRRTEDDTRTRRPGRAKVKGWQETSREPF